MDQKMQFIADYLRQALSSIELCALYGVSRKNGYQWIERDLKHGPLGLEEHSRQPHSSPRTAPASPGVGRQETAGHAPDTSSELAVTGALHRL